MNIRFHGAAVHVPAGWVDQSVLLFSLPPNPALNDPRALQRQQAVSEGNIAITREGPSKGPLTTLLASHLERLTVGRSHTVLQAPVGDDVQAHTTVRFEDGRSFVQRLCAVRRGQDVFMIVATGSGTTLSTSIHQEFDRISASFLASSEDLSDSSS